MEALPLVRRGEVHHCGGASGQSGPAPGAEIVGGDGPADLQVEMGVCVDESGEQKLPRAVDGLRPGGGHLRTYGGDPFALQEDVRRAHPGAADNASAF